MLVDIIVLAHVVSVQYCVYCVTVTVVDTVLYLSNKGTCGKQQGLHTGAVACGPT